MEGKNGGPSRGSGGKWWKRWRAKWREMVEVTWRRVVGQVERSYEMEASGGKKWNLVWRSV